MTVSIFFIYQSDFEFRQRSKFLPPFLPETFAVLEVCGTSECVEQVLCRELTVGFAGSASARNKKVFTLKIRCDSFCIAESAAVCVAVGMAARIDGQCPYKRRVFKAFLRI
jgi:hypothetical protein